jgi:hypothetical protein
VQEVLAHLLVEPLLQVPVSSTLAIGEECLPTNF